MYLINMPELSCPNNLILDVGIFMGGCIYSRLDGTTHHAAVSMGGHIFVDILKIILSSNCNSSFTKSPHSATSILPVSSSFHSSTPSTVMDSTIIQAGKSGPQRSQPWNKQPTSCESFVLSLWQSVTNTSPDQTKVSCQRRTLVRTAKSLGWLAGWDSALTGSRRP